jgi:very-short-patch-repair endonuclease
MPRIPPRLTANARELRRDATDTERALWRILSPYRPRFTRQLPVGDYVLDLACRWAKLAIEIDGSQHIGSEYDEERTRFLESLGWKVIRFWNSDVSDNPDGVAESILEKVTACLDPTHPRPLPVSREGRR